MVDDKFNWIYLVMLVMPLLRWAAGSTGLMHFRKQLKYKSEDR